MKNAARIFLASACTISLIPMTRAQDVAPAGQPVLLAAGSLTQAMNEMINAYAAQGGARFVAQYGPSGKLRQDIESGKRADVFASASIEHSDELAARKLMGPSAVFTHNDLCVAARPALALNETNLLEVLARPSVRLATSTPVSDPMGDYTWQFFRNADQKQPGLYQVLDAKALKLSGGGTVPVGVKPPYVTAFEDDKADAYIMYCTNAVSTQKAVPQLAVVRLPDALNVRSAYGIAARPDSQEGQRFVHFVMQPAGQAILKKYGFQ